MDVTSSPAAQVPAAVRGSDDAAPGGIRQGSERRVRRLFLAGRPARGACRSVPTLHPGPRGPPCGA